MSRGQPSRPPACRRSRRRRPRHHRPHEVVADWPKPPSPICPATRTGRGAQCRASLKRAPTSHMVQRGELPASGPRLVRFPMSDRACRFVGQAPFRNASQGPASSPPGAGGPARIQTTRKQAYRDGWASMRDGSTRSWCSTRRRSGRGLDAVVTVDAGSALVFVSARMTARKLREDRRRPHTRSSSSPTTAVNPCRRSALRKKQDRTAFISTALRPCRGCPMVLFVADGYNGNRVAKFDKEGKFLWTSGELGTAGGRETRTRLLQHRAWHHSRSDDAARVCQRSLESANPGARRRQQGARTADQYS